MKHFLYITLTLTLCMMSCRSERTVYDQYGNVVKESVPGEEKDIYTVMEERFDAAFSEKKNKDGVPETASSRVSRYQRDIDNARTGGKQFLTKAFTASSESGIRDKVYGESGKDFGGRKTFAGIKNDTYSRDLRPDFLNENRGLAHKDYMGSHIGKRSGWENRASADSGERYYAPLSQYNGHERSTYIQSRESRREQPLIYDHQNQGTKSIEDTRRLLGRDESAL